MISRKQFPGLPTHQIFITAVNLPRATKPHPIHIKHNPFIASDCPRETTTRTEHEEPLEMMERLFCATEADSKLLAKKKIRNITSSMEVSSRALEMLWFVSRCFSFSQIYSRREETVCEPLFVRLSHAYLLSQCSAPGERFPCKGTTLYCPLP